MHAYLLFYAVCNKILWRKTDCNYVYYWLKIKRETWSYWPQLAIGRLCLLGALQYLHFSSSVFSFSAKCHLCDIRFCYLLLSPNFLSTDTSMLFSVFKLSYLFFFNFLFAHLLVIAGFLLYRLLASIPGVVCLQKVTRCFFAVSANAIFSLCQFATLSQNYLLLLPGI